MFLDDPNKPKEADEWYKQALERARSIAKNIGQSSSTSKGPINDISPQSSSSSSMIYSPHQKQASNYDIGKNGITYITFWYTFEGDDNDQAR